ncbi:MAG: diadenylate cyclase CdaA [Bacteroidaceae bacterium]|nr:diadenylate cyclase CdaA [Bacteroidaceae bacterium]
MIDFAIKDIIDIVLVALILSYIYRLMKQSSAANVFSGILVFIFVWLLVSEVFNMRLMGSIMDQMMSIGSLGLIVLFQKEIRHFLSSIGARNRGSKIIELFTNRKTTDERSQRNQIMPVVMACLSLAKQKVGALIVIERNVGLREEMESGDYINANISQRLIENIFFKNSPLHDGAMIISGKRIHSAGCILPVSHDTNIPKSLGLRHRAALGVSQKSDCISIIVSEETGSITVAMNGAFRLRLTGEDLEQILVSEWRF